MKNSNSISFRDALKRSNYPIKIREQLKLFVSENISNYKDNTEIYLTYCFGKNIIVIKHCLNV